MKMHDFPSKAIVERLHQRFPAGTRVELVRMNDSFSKLKPGDRGTVMFCDDAGTLHTNWDCGSSLGVVFGIDEVRKIEDTDDD
jgi:hypothetical protein